MFRRYLAVLATVFVATAPTAVDAAEWAKLAENSKTPGDSTESANAEPRIYNAKAAGYSVAVPPDAEVVERKDAKQLSIRSRKGYVINIQAGPVRSEIPLTRMSALLEAKYMGQGKLWSVRGAERPMKAGGLRAHDVAYQGNQSEARVVVARGRQKDYVFIFIASERDFRKLEPEFNWLLTHFRPDPKDLPSPVASPETVDAGSTRRFAEAGYGYVIEYPADWEFTKPSRMTAMFSGQEGTPAYAAIIGIQNIQPPGARNADEAAQRALNQLRSSLGNAVRDLRIVADESWTYARGALQLVGRRIDATYQHGRETFRKRMIVVPRPRGTVAHVWSYTAPQRQFAALRPYADRMLRSWTILTEQVK